MKGSSFSFHSGECEPLKNVLRKFHREKITNMASVSCVCSRSAVGSRWTSQMIDCLCRAHSPGLSQEASTPTWAKANKSKCPLNIFTSQTFTWGSCTQIRSFSSPDPNIEGNRGDTYCTFFSPSVFNPAKIWLESRFANYDVNNTTAKSKPSFLWLLQVPCEQSSKNS